MSLSQPSRTIVVEPVEAATTAPPPAEPPPREPPLRVEEPVEPRPAGQTVARP